MDMLAAAGRCLPRRSAPIAARQRDSFGQASPPAPRPSSVPLLASGQGPMPSLVKAGFGPRTMGPGRGLSLLLPPSGCRGADDGGRQSATG